MRVIYTDQALVSLQEALNFAFEIGLSSEKVIELRNRLLDRADSLQLNPYKGQREPYLAHLNEGHRRIIEGNFKIIYKVEDGLVLITGFFDSREDPLKMKG